MLKIASFNASMSFTKFDYRYIGQSETNWKQSTNGTREIDLTQIRIKQSC